MKHDWNGLLFKLMYGLLCPKNLHAVTYHSNANRERAYLAEPPFASGKKIGRRGRWVCFELRRTWTWQSMMVGVVRVSDAGLLTVEMGHAFIVL